MYEPNLSKLPNDVLKLLESTVTVAMPSNQHLNQNMRDNMFAENQSQTALYTYCRSSIYRRSCRVL